MLRKAARDKIFKLDSTEEQHGESASGGDHAQHGPTAQPRAAVGGIEHILKDLVCIRNWVMETGMGILISDPESAVPKLRELLASLCAKNPGLIPVLSDIGMGNEDTIAFAEVGSKLRKAEEQQQDILKELGPAKRRRGRPFGRQTAVAEDGEVTPSKTDQKKRKKKHHRQRRRRRLMRMRKMKSS